MSSVNLTPNDIGFAKEACKACVRQYSMYSALSTRILYGRMSPCRVEGI